MLFTRPAWDTLDRPLSGQPIAKTAEEAEERDTRRTAACPRRGLAVAVDLRGQGMPHLEIRKAPNRLGYRTRTGKHWRHPEQIVKLLRSFAGKD